MAGETQNGNRADRVEMILRQLDSLPTLNAIAVRLLELTTAEEARSSEVVKLISSDPSLTGKVLKLCRCNSRGRASKVNSIERAVLLIGFDAVRTAVLSVQVLELFEGMESPGGEMRDEEPLFDPKMFWRHSIAVAVAGEMLVQESGLRNHLSSGEAFVGGLLHDLGRLVMHVLLPRSFDRVCELAESHAVSVDAASAQLIGVDTHTAGKRLAEHWGLPEPLADVMWLHGHEYATLPDRAHKPLIGVISLADVLARRLHIATVGDRPRQENLDAMGAALGIDRAVIDRIIDALPDEVAERAEGFGINIEHGTAVLLRSISRANDVLGRINHTLQKRARTARTFSNVLSAITRFHAQATPNCSLPSVLGRVMQSASETFGGSVFVALCRDQPGSPWRFHRFAEDGRLLESDLLVDGGEDQNQSPLPGKGTVKDSSGTENAWQAALMLPLIQKRLGEGVDWSRVHIWPLPESSSHTTLLLLNGTKGEDETREALLHTWAATASAATQRDDRERMSEDLAAANRDLQEAKESLARSETYAAVGAIAAGAAHELNNPLTVISGRSQMLANRILDQDLRVMAEQIVSGAHRATDIISALRMFAEPVEMDLQRVNLEDLVMRVVQTTPSRSKRRTSINTSFAHKLPEVMADPETLTGALSELVQNALEAEGVNHVEIRVQEDKFDGRLMIQVKDDGNGLTPEALERCFDPFFSSKPAGRQPGLGLAQARHLIEALNGEITLVNRSGKGAVATVRLPVGVKKETELRQVA